MGTQYVGKRIPRVDALDKVTGQAVYSVDVELPGMLYGAALRSPLAHAKIVEIDTSAARTAPGVRAVVTGEDFPFTFGHMIKDQPFLSIRKVRYVGEPVAAVAAETEAEAQEAVEKIRVEYEELPAVFDPREAALDGAPIIHEDLGTYDHGPIYEIVPGTNISTVMKYSRGDVGVGFSEADEIFEDEFYIHPVAHTPMETHAAVVQYARSGKMLTVWSAVDAPSQRAKDLANVLGLSCNQVRFISTYSGGGFGGKGAIVAEGIGIALAHFTKGRPVKMIYSRQEELTASQVRLEAFLKLKTGVKRDGTLTAREAEVIWDNGAYASKGPEVARRGTLTIFGPYRTPHIALLSRLIYTNKQPSGAYRGFGTSQVTWACESQMDIIAGKLGIDPVEIRLRNFYADGDPYINGQIMDTAGLRETLEEATREIGWGRKKPKIRGTKVQGTGIATTIKGTSTPTDS
ncbi:MAG: molybdopterin-dependent oxidoreductase, partial [Deltaproteobacteria bacterium]|nr:molybdopterin-dependent oxidoreductase [Deltaproteobacteria bacterium]